MISADAYPFWLSQTLPVTLKIQEWVFSGCTVPPNSKDTELKSSDQETSPSASKNTGIVLMSCYIWKCVPTDFSSGADFDGCHEFTVRVTKLFQGLASHELAAYLFLF